METFFLLYYKNSTQPCPKYSNNKFAKSLQYLKNGQVSLIKLCHGNYLLPMSVKVPTNDEFCMKNGSGNQGSNNSIPLLPL